MNLESRLLGALAALSLTACAPAGDGPSDAPASKGAAAAEEGKEDLRVEAYPDVDPETGIDRNVTYEPQIGPAQPERSRKDRDKTAPTQGNVVAPPKL